MLLKCIPECYDIMRSLCKGRNTKLLLPNISNLLLQKLNRVYCGNKVFGKNIRGVSSCCTRSLTALQAFWVQANQMKNWIREFGKKTCKKIVHTTIKNDYMLPSCYYVAVNRTLKQTKDT